LSFLDCNGVPLNQQGRFHLPRVPPDILQDIVKDWMDDYFPSFVDIEPTVPPDFDVGSNPTLDENGKFKLPTVDPALIDWFLPKYAPSPTQMMSTLVGKTLYEHEANIRAAMLRAEAGKLNPRFHLWMLQAREKDYPTALPPEAMTEKRAAAYYRTPAIMDTGASFGLTPFIEDFITYQKVNIKIKDVSQENTVTGMGTVLYRIKAENGDTCWIPGLAYHLESTDIRLISPQAYHQQYGGHSTIDGNSFRMHLVRPSNEGEDAITVGHILGIPLDRGSNLPMVFDVACSLEEQRKIGSHFRTSLAFKQRVEGMFFGSWETVRVEDEDHDNEKEVTYEFGPYKHHLFPCVTSAANENLTAEEKYLLLWHFKLGCSLKKVQHLMQGHTRTDADGNKVFHPPVLPVPTGLGGVRSCALPKCSTCEIARAKVKRTTTKKVRDRKEKKGALVKNKYLPGDLVSMDTVSVSIPGRRFSGYGKEGPNQAYSAFTIFHDAGSGVIKAFPQVSGGATDTLLSKAKFEDWMWTEAGVHVKKYHSDQGVFTSANFREDCIGKHQQQTFSAVGSKWQNGNAERSVQTLLWMSRSSMLHCSLRWATNDADSPSLWPQALSYSEFLFNRTPSMSNGLTPLERLTQRKSDHQDLLRAHVWGAPTYVLDSRLQDGNRVPRFDQRARLGQFLGFSPEHSTMVGLIRHCLTGHISAQYHTVYDDTFDTVFGMAGDATEALDAKVQEIWTDLFKDDGSAGTRDWYCTPEFDPDAGDVVYDVPPLDVHWLNEEELRDRETRLQDQLRRKERERIKYESQFKPREQQAPSRKVRFSTDPPVVEATTSGDDEASFPDEPLLASEGESDDVEVGTVDVGDVGSSSDTSTSTSERTWSKKRLREKRSSWKDRASISQSNWSEAQHFTPKQMAALSKLEKKILRDERYSAYFGNFGITLSDQRQVPTEVKRQQGKKLPRSYKFARSQEIGAQQLRGMKAECPTVEELLASPLSKFINFAANDCGYDGSFTTLVTNWVHPLFLSAKTGISKEDNPSWQEAMNGDEAEQYWEAACTEVATLEAMDAWEVVDRPKDRRVLPSLWAFRRKRNPDGTIRKYKARFTARGDKQIAGVDFNETWAPVTKWTTIRLMFILQCCLDLKSASADVACAFLHGSLDEGEEVYIEMPKGFQQEGKCLKLKRSLYGLKQAPRCFWKYLVETMGAVGMQQSEHDPCMFIGEKVIAVAYVDDILFWARDDEDITTKMAELRSKGLLLEKESSAAGFLGVDIKVLEKDGSGKPTRMELTQTGLIDRIITNLGLDGAEHYGKFTPAEATPLTRDAGGAECIEDFNVAAVVGQLLYLSGHTRPDIAYAVNIVARYMFCPKRSHELALKRIGKYLKATRTKGLIITPSDNILDINAFPDADFAGLYGHEAPNDPACVKSRTGFVILAANCPVMWKSTLQTKTALSTTEAEITALAHCCKELFPIMDLAKHLAAYYNLDPVKTTMNVTIHEDNAAALILAKMLPPEHTPRSKFFHLETVWFREEIVKRCIELKKVVTTDQLGDMFTKGLSKVVFEYLRFKLCGW
jgi:transposase InsO family protein